MCQLTLVRKIVRFAPDAVDTLLPALDTMSDGVVAVDLEIGTDAPDVPVDVGREDCVLCPDAVDTLLPALDTISDNVVAVDSEIDSDAPDVPVDGAGEDCVLCPDAVDPLLPAEETISTVVNPGATDGVVAVDSGIGTDAPDVIDDDCGVECVLPPGAAVVLEPMTMF